MRQPETTISTSVETWECESAPSGSHFPGSFLKRKIFFARAYHQSRGIGDPVGACLSPTVPSLRKTFVQKHRLDVFQRQRGFTVGLFRLRAVSEESKKQTKLAGGS